MNKWLLSGLVAAGIYTGCDEKKDEDSLSQIIGTTHASIGSTDQEGMVEFESHDGTDHMFRVVGENGPLEGAAVMYLSDPEFQFGYIRAAGYAPLTVIGDSEKEFVYDSRDGYGSLKMALNGQDKLSQLRMTVNSLGSSVREVDPRPAQALTQNQNLWELRGCTNADELDTRQDVYSTIVSIGKQSGFGKIFGVVDNLYRTREALVDILVRSGLIETHECKAYNTYALIPEGFATSGHVFNDCLPHRCEEEMQDVDAGIDEDMGTGECLDDICERRDGNCYFSEEFSERPLDRCVWPQQVGTGTLQDWDGLSCFSGCEITSEKLYLDTTENNLTISLRLRRVVNSTDFKFSLRDLQGNEVYTIRPQNFSSPGKTAFGIGCASDFKDIEVDSALAYTVGFQVTSEGTAFIYSEQGSADYIREAAPNCLVEKKGNYRMALDIDEFHTIEHLLVEEFER